MKKLILVSGKAQHGKDSSAEILYDLLPGNKTILHFGDHAKEVAKKYYGWSGKKDEEGRKKLQYVGTELIRKRNNDYWANMIFNLIDVIGEDFDYILIADTRFHNEIDIARLRYSDKVETLRVNRVHFESELSPLQKQHISETELDDYIFDYTISVENGLDNLREALTNMLAYSDFFRKKSASSSISGWNIMRAPIYTCGNGDPFGDMFEKLKLSKDANILRNLRTMYDNYKKLAGKDNLFIDEVGKLIGMYEPPITMCGTYQSYQNECRSSISGYGIG
jgi:hypothetical protein